MPRINSYLTPPASNETYQATSSCLSPPPQTTEEKARRALSHAIKHTGALDQYVLHRVIGFGANGVVLAAEQLSDTGKFEPVAIKLIYKPSANRNCPVPTSSDNVPNEIKILRAMALNPHPGLLRYITDYQDTRNYYLVTELFGTDWIAMTKSIRNANNVLANADSDALPPFHILNPRFGVDIVIPFSSGSADLWAWSYFERCVAWSHGTAATTKLPVPVIKQIAFQSLSAMAHLHECLGFFHADIKVENLLLTVMDNQDGTNEENYNVSVRICDFGHSDRLSVGMKHIGTVGNASPELVANEGKRGVDGAKADVYALGVLIMKLLDASGVFEADLWDETELRLVDNLLQGMLAEVPEERLSMRQAAMNSWFL
ncbi:kinase-like domain-containing protein [Obelidium mucronatum]|nr:kinase-like domain-containing protein [Obelidium mucronatum]